VCVCFVLFYCFLFYGQMCVCEVQDATFQEFEMVPRFASHGNNKETFEEVAIRTTSCCNK